MGESVFAEAFSELLEASLTNSEALGEVLDEVELSEDFVNDGLSKSLRQVSRGVGARDVLRTERDTFFVSIGGFDTHSNMAEKLDENLLEVDTALGSFAKEMKAQGAWEDVTVIVMSEFGRTLSSNGRGTDHGWA